MSRAITLTSDAPENRGLPLAGRIAAGMLHEAIEQNERVDFGQMFSSDDMFVLEVSGDSMIEDQITDGDYVVCRKQDTAEKGQIVVALTDENEATLKRWYPEPSRNRIRLEPANSTMEPIYVQNARVLGVVTGVVRQVG
jgi:repressor LexA